MTVEQLILEVFVVRVTISIEAVFLNVVIASVLRAVSPMTVEPKLELPVTVDRLKLPFTAPLKFIVSPVFAVSSVSPSKVTAARANSEAVIFPESRVTPAVWLKLFLSVSSSKIIFFELAKETVPVVESVVSLFILVSSLKFMSPVAAEVKESKVLVPSMVTALHFVILNAAAVRALPVAVAKLPLSLFIVIFS